MEDFLIILLQALGEFIFELLAWWPWDWFWYWGDSRWNPPRRADPFWVAIFSSVAVGALLGWASIHFFPAVIVRWSWLRVTLLFVSPPLSGFMAREWAKWRHKQNALIDFDVHFLIGLCFSIGFVWVRFALANRHGG
jgi:hypothetical protein